MIGRFLEELWIESGNIKGFFLAITYNPYIHQGVKMKNTKYLILSSILLFSYGTKLLAQPQDGPGPDSPHDFFSDEPENGEKANKEKFENKSPEEKLVLFEQKRAERLKKMEEKFISMSDQDKIDFVNKRFKKMKEHMDTKWNSMSKEEKLEMIEKRMNRRKGGPGHHKRRGNNFSERE